MAWRAAESLRVGSVTAILRTGIWLVVALFALPPVVPSYAELEGTDGGSGRPADIQPFLLDMAVVADYLGHVNPMEARAALESYSQIYARNIGLPVDVQVYLFQTFADLRKTAARGQLKVLGLQTQDYFQLRKETGIDPALIPVRAGSTTDRYLILAPRDSAWTSIAQLRGRHLTAYSGTQMGLSMPWLEGLLREAKLPAARAYFGQVQIHVKVSQALLPVFFGNADICLVAASEYETMVELNPQLGRKLQIVAASPELVPFVICLRSDFVGENREGAERGYLEAHLHALGQQALLLFGFERLQPATEEDFESARRIVERLDMLP